VCLVFIIYENRVHQKVGEKLNTGILGALDSTLAFS
jgi:hypothetical protein